MYDTGSSLLNTSTLSELGTQTQMGSDDISAEAIVMMVTLLLVMTLVSISGC